MRPTRAGRAATVFTLLGAALAGAITAACSDLSPTTPDSTANAASTPPSFLLTTLIDPAGATSVSAVGINAADHVVGFYATADGRVHGFVARGSQDSTIDYPGALNTDARGIGPNDEVVGQYSNAGEPPVAKHGYLLTAQGAFQAVHFPGHLYEIPQRILPDGTIFGCRHDHDTMGSMKGIEISRKDTSDITAYASMSNGATPDLSRIVGLYTDSATNIAQGYLIDRGTFTPLLAPGATATAAWDIDPRGEVVGQYTNATGVHGFVLTGSTWTTVDFPGATATRIYGINAAGDIVGAYVAGGHSHGFLGVRGS